MKKWEGIQKYSKDMEIELQLEKMIDQFKISPLELINGFPIYARRTSLKHFLALYELFRNTINLPGDIVELGVFRGQTLMMWANFLECRNIGDRTKKVWGFDNFRGFRKLRREDGPSYKHVHKRKDDYGAGYFEDVLNEAIRIFDQDRFVPWKNRIELVKGDVEKTIPQFVKKNPGLRISLLHFDIDLYEPTMMGLKHLFPLVVPGGVVVFDEYGVLEWGGESAAVEKYLHKEGYTLKKFDWNNRPGGYLVKKGKGSK